MGREITELSTVDFHDIGKTSLGEAFKIYGDRLQVLGERLAFELELAAGDAEAAMSTLGHWWWLGMDVRWKSKRVARRLVRAQEMAWGIGKSGPKIYRAYQRNFGEAARRGRN